MHPPLTFPRRRSCFPLLRLDYPTSSSDDGSDDDDDDENFVGKGGKWEFLGEPQKKDKKRTYFTVRLTTFFQ